MCGGRGACWGGREGEEGGGGVKWRGSLCSLCPASQNLAGSEEPAGGRQNYLSTFPFPLCADFPVEKKMKSGAINNPVTAVVSWRLTECADARQPGLGGQVAFKKKPRHKTTVFPSVIPQLHLAPSPWAADHTPTLAWADRAGVGWPSGWGSKVGQGIQEGAGPAQRTHFTQLLRCGTWLFLADLRVAKSQLVSRPGTRANSVLISVLTYVLGLFPGLTKGGQTGLSVQAWGWVWGLSLPRGVPTSGSWYEDLYRCLSPDQLQDLSPVLLPGWRAGRGEAFYISGPVSGEGEGGR